MLIFFCAASDFRRLKFLNTTLHSRRPFSNHFACDPTNLMTNSPIIFHFSLRSSVRRRETGEKINVYIEALNDTIATVKCLSSDRCTRKLEMLRSLRVDSEALHVYFLSNILIYCLKFVFDKHQFDDRIRTGAENYKNEYKSSVFPLVI